MALFAIAATLVSWRAVVLVRETWKETKRTADEARRANDLATRQFNAGFKPWLTVRISGPYVDNGRETLKSFAKDEPNERRISILAAIEITNAGDMPATITRCVTGAVGLAHWTEVQQDRSFAILAKGESFFANPPDHRQVRPVLDERIPTAMRYPTHAVFDLTRENRVDFMQNPNPIYGKIRYEDPLGRQFEFAFAFRKVGASWSPSDSFERWGGKEYNYDRENPDQE